MQKITLSSIITRERRKEREREREREQTFDANLLQMLVRADCCKARHTNVLPRRKEEVDSVKKKKRIKYVI